MLGRPLHVDPIGPDVAEVSRRGHDVLNAPVGLPEETARRAVLDRLCQIEVAGHDGRVPPGPSPTTWSRPGGSRSAAAPASARPASPAPR